MCGDGPSENLRTQESFRVSLRVLDCGPVRVVSFAVLTIVLELSGSADWRLAVERKEDPLVSRLGALVVSQAGGALLL